MAVPKWSRGKSTVTTLVPIFALARAVVFTTLRLVRSLRNALRARGAVLDVEALQDDFARDLYAGVEMPDCHSCKQERARQNLEPRPLHRLPLEVTQDKNFQRQGLPVAVCLHCDGGVYASATETHKSRSSS